MNAEKITWVALSGAVFTVFWPWMFADRIVSTLIGDTDDSDAQN